MITDLCIQPGIDSLLKSDFSYNVPVEINSSTLFIVLPELWNVDRKFLILFKLFAARTAGELGEKWSRIGKTILDPNL